MKNGISHLIGLKVRQRNYFAIMSKSVPILIFLSLWLFLTSGCSTVVREMQLSESLHVSSSEVVDGQTLALSVKLWIESPDMKGNGLLSGRAIVTAASGTMPQSIDLYDFQVIRKQFGGTSLYNYGRDQNGTWTYASARFPGENPVVTVTQSQTNIIMNFQLTDRHRPTDTYSIAVSFSDFNRERHTLMASAQTAIK